MEVHTPQTFIDSAKAFGPFLAAMAAFVVGGMQYYLQRQKLKQDLFDKRFHVYESTVAYLILMLQNDGKTEIAEYQEFKRNTDPGEFFLSAEIFAFIKDIGELGTEFRHLQLYRDAHVQRANSALSEAVTYQEAGIVKALYKKQFNEESALVTDLDLKIDDLRRKVNSAVTTEAKQVFQPALQLHYSESLPERLVAVIDRLDSGMQKLMRSRYDR
jgi:hypothetical protein